METIQKPQTDERWYYADGKEKLGPFSFGQLRETALRGQLRPTSMIWREGTQKWMTADSMPSLFGGETTSVVEAAPVTSNSSLPGPAQLSFPKWRLQLLAGAVGLVLLLGIGIWIFNKVSQPTTSLSASVHELLANQDKSVQDKSSQKRDEKPDSTPPTFTNAIGMKLRLIPAGEFWMGSTEAEEGRDPSEHRHLVKITRPFYMGVHEVTQEQFEKIMGYKRSPNTEADGPDFPVTPISWDEAIAFCNKLSV
jgi:hypothetical protein